MTETYMSDYLRNKVRATAKRTEAAYTGLALGAAGAIGGILLSPVLYALLPLSILLLFLALTCKPSWRWGLEGEERLRGRLRRILDDRCALFFNLPIAGGDLDCVVVAPQGLWVMESKYYAGEVTCTNGRWCRLRKRRGETYPEAMRSPSEQLSKGITHLKSYLLSQGISPWIRGIVVFTHPAACLHVQGLGTVSAVTLSDLTGLPPGPELPEATRSAIVEALTSLSTRKALRRSA